MKYNRTIEQSNIVSCLDENIVVNAFAGTGKTSTLIDYTKTNNEETYLYLAFNKSVQENASKKFNSHVRCSTSHSLAYRDIGFKFKDKLGQTKAATISKIFKCNFATASVALNSLNNFLYSADYYLDIEKHLDKNHSTGMNVNLAFSITEKIWKSMQDTSNPYIRMSHDGYLKLYHLSNPKILMDVILIDEAQDSNMVLLDIVNKQKARKIYIGDTNQNIYGFRKSIDALSLNTDATKFNLTGSFRFGDGIAKLATLLLQEWKGEKNTIKGLGDTKTKFSVNKNNPHAILARTNSGLFDAAIEALLSNKPFGYVGGPEGYRLDMILDAWHLKQGKNHLITDPTILLFSSFNELVDYAESIDDKECKMLIRVIEKYGSEIPVLINRIKTEVKIQFSGDEILLSTAHKAKGIEFESVILTDDYTDLKITKDVFGRETYPSIEEINILYVALTRAATNLQMNNSLIDWLKENKHYNGLVLN